MVFLFRAMYFRHNLSSIYKSMINETQEDVETKKRVDKAESANKSDDCFQNDMAKSLH